MFPARSLIKMACPILVALTTAVTGAIPAVGAVGTGVLAVGVMNAGNAAAQAPKLSQAGGASRSGMIIRDDLWLGAVRK
jgi:hypothetical protein